MSSDNDGSPPGYKFFGKVGDGGVQKAVWVRSLPREDNNACDVDWAIQCSWDDVKDVKLDERTVNAMVQQAFGHNSMDNTTTAEITRILLKKQIDKLSLSQVKMVITELVTLTKPLRQGLPNGLKPFGEMSCKRSTEIASNLLYYLPSIEQVVQLLDRMAECPHMVDEVAEHMKKSSEPRTPFQP